MDRDALMQQHLPLVARALRRFGFRGRGIVDDEDLRAEALLALWQALECFDESRGLPVEAWAYQRIVWRLSDVCRDHVPGGKRCAEPVGIASLDRAHTRDDDQGLPPEAGAHDPGFAAVDVLSPRMRAALGQLPARERAVLVWRAGGRLLDDVAARLGLSASRVAQLEAQARAHMRGALRFHGIAALPSAGALLAPLSAHVQRVLEAQAIALDLQRAGALAWSRQGRFKTGPRRYGTVHEAIAAVLGATASTVRCQAWAARTQLGVAEPEDAARIWRQAHPVADPALRRCLLRGTRAPRLRRAQRPGGRLTPLQARYVALLALGLPPQQIGRLYGIPENRVNMVLAHAYRVLGVRSGAAAIAAWRQVGPLYDVTLPAVPAELRRRRPSGEALPSRSVAVLDRLAEGAGHAEVASALGLGTRTVATYASLGYRVLGISSRIELAACWPRERERWLSRPRG